MITAKGVGRYVSIKVPQATEDVGKAMQSVKEIGVSEGDTVFFAPSEITLQDEDGSIFTFVRPEDIYAVLTDVS